MEWTNTDEQTDERMVPTSNRHIFIDNDVLIVICVKFHNNMTIASLKSNLTKKLYLNGMDIKKTGWSQPQINAFFKQ